MESIRARRIQVECVLLGVEGWDMLMTIRISILIHVPDLLSFDECFGVTVSAELVPNV